MTSKRERTGHAFTGNKTGIFIVPAPVPPADSWWTLAQTREEFQALAAAERPRMARSSSGRAARLISAKDSDAEAV